MKILVAILTIFLLLPASGQLVPAPPIYIKTDVYPWTPSSKIVRSDEKPIDTAEITVNLTCGCKLTHQAVHYEYIPKVTVSHDEYKLEVESAMMSVNYKVYYGSTLIDSGTLGIGGEVKKRHGYAEYYVKCTGVGYFTLGEFEAYLYTPHIGELTVYSTTYELSNMPVSNHLKVKLVTIESSAPTYSLNGEQRNDPNGIHSYRSSPYEDGKITITLNHKSDWARSGNVARISETYTYGMSKLEAYCNESTGTLFSKTYKGVTTPTPTTPSPYPPLPTDQQNLVIVAILVLLALAVIMRR